MHIKESNSVKNTLILYGKKGSKLVYKNNIFYAENKQEVFVLNTELKKYTFAVSELDLKSESINSIFVINIQGDVKPLQSTLLKLTNILEGAYIKPKAENP